MDYTFEKTAALTVRVNSYETLDRCLDAFSGYTRADGSEVIVDSINFEGDIAHCEEEFELAIEELFELEPFGYAEIKEWPEKYGYIVFYK